MEKTDLNFIAKRCADWRNGMHEPHPRLPIIAIVRIGDFDDDMDINDDGMFESISEDNGCEIPVCGVSYDSGGAGTVITPFCVRASDANELTFISWRRVVRWRYLDDLCEAPEQWAALKREAGKRGNYHENY